MEEGMQPVVSLDAAATASHPDDRLLTADERVHLGLPPPGGKYTFDGHWVGPGKPTQPPPRLVARCGGPGLCSRCALEAGQYSGSAAR